MIFAAACLATAAIWWLLTLNLYQGVSAWWFVRFVPGGGAIRCVSRVCLIVDLFAVLGAIVWLDGVTARLRWSGMRVVVIGTVAAAIVFEQTGYVPKNFAKDAYFGEVRGYAEDVRGADAIFLIPREDRPPFYTDVEAMWVGLEANVPTVNGYSGRTPPGYPYDYSVNLEDYGDDRLRRWLEGKFRGRIAIVDPDRRGQVRYLDME
jgi:hypothetical protein